VNTPCGISRSSLRGMITKLADLHVLVFESNDSTASAQGLHNPAVTGTWMAAAGP
jgi:hypothetical protein